MKKILIMAIVLVFFASVSTAEMLLTADTLGTGKIGLQGAFINTSNHTFSSNNNTGYGGLVGYGLSPVLDIYGILGFVDYTNLGPGTTANGPQTGVAIKYKVMDGLSTVASYRITNVNVKNNFGSGQANLVTDDWMGGLILSNTFRNMVPYLGAAYHSLNQKFLGTSASATNAEITAGVKFSPVKDIAVLLEYAYNSITPDFGSAQNSSNISLSVGTKL